MFLYNIYHIVRQNELKSYIRQTYSSRIANETSYLLPKQDRQTENVFLIPQRHVLGIMGFLAIVNAYTLRVAMSVAITEMVTDKGEDSTHYDPDACEGTLSNTTSTVTDPDILYPWTSSEQGLILSSFYWGYVLTHMPGGMIAERFGGKYTLGLGLLVTSIFVFLLPLVIYITNGDAICVMIMCFIQGLGEGTTFPAVGVLMAQWIPLEERSRIGSLILAGSQIGTVFGNSISGLLISATKDWAPVFYFFGAVGCTWVFLWMLLGYSDPSSHPFITDEEKEFLQRKIEGISKKKRPIPWKSILTSVPVWALVAAQIGHDWGFFTMVTDLPKYMKDVLKYNVKENGLLSSVPYIAMWIVSLIGGYLCDYLIKHKYLSVTNSRKLFTTTASMGPAIFILLATYAGCDRNLAVISFTVGMGFMGTFYCGMRVNSLDLSPNYAGTVTAIVNGVGGLTGIIVPYIASALTEDHTLVEWRLVFWISFGVFLVTNLTYAIFASGEIQWWNEIDDCDTNTDDKEEKRDVC